MKGLQTLCGSMENVMKKLIVLILTIMTFTAGCTRNIIHNVTKDSHHGVFQKYLENKPIPHGYSELTVFSSLKTPAAGTYDFGSKIIGTPEYMLLIDIDGQQKLVKGELRKEISDPVGLNDSEAGEGIRYLFKTDLVLKAGSHKLYVALPAEKVDIEREFTVKDGTFNILRIYPIYGSREPEGMPGRGMFSSSTFMEGIDGLWVYLNGDEL
jgi:hypothetical protein